MSDECGTPSPQQSQRSQESPFAIKTTQQLMAVSSNNNNNKSLSIKGKLWRVPSKDTPTVQAAVEKSRDGDSIYLEPGVYIITESLMITHSIHLIGIDEVGDSALLQMDGGTLRPSLPILRLDAASCRLKGLRLAYTHGKDALPQAVENSYAVLVGRGSATLDEIIIESSCGGIRGVPGTYVTLVCGRLQAQQNAVCIEGKGYLDRCTVAGGRTGVLVRDTASCTIEGNCFTGCEVGISNQQRGIVHCYRSAFTSVKCGVLLSNTELPTPRPPEVRSCEFRHMSECAVRTEGEGCTVDLSKNLIHQLTETSAVAVHCNGGRPEVHSNVIRECKGVGLRCTAGAPLIESNVIEHCDLGVHVLSSRPTIRLNEISYHTTAGLLVESAAIASKCPTFISPHLQKNANNERQQQHDDIIHPLNEADPHVEANMFAGNNINVVVRSVTANLMKNELGVTEKDNVVLDGPQSVAVVVSGNIITGSRQGCCVLAENGVEARIQGNDMRGAKLAAVCLCGSSFCEVRGNNIEDCQGALTATNKACGKVWGNDTHGLTVDVFMDSQATVLVHQ